MKTLFAVALIGATLTASTTAHAWVGQATLARMKQNRDTYRAQRLMQKQQDLLIKRNPQLKMVRQLKMLEYTAADKTIARSSAVGFGAGMLMGLTTPGTGNGQMVAGALVITATTAALGMFARHEGARDYARAETVKYAAERGIALAPRGLKLGVLAADAK